MKKTRLNRLLLVVLLVATMLSLTSVYLVPDVKALPTYEDFTSYTESDPVTRIQILNSTYLNFTNYIDDGDTEDIWLYKDSGTNHFQGDFEHKLDFQETQGGTNVKGPVWALTNGIDDLGQLDAAGGDWLAIYWHDLVAEELYLAECDGGTLYTDKSVVLALSTMYYLLISRSGTTLTCGIYSSAALRDAEGVADVDTLTLTLQSAVSYRYILPCVSYFVGAGAAFSNKLIYNLDLQYNYEYTFYGLYNEVTGLRDGAVNVTAYFSEGYYSNTFTVDGVYVYGHLQKPVYFSFNLTNNREYWLGANEDSATIYIFDDSTTAYTISFMDFAGILNEFSYIEAHRYVNATLYIVEKRQVDVENKIMMNLIDGDIYTIIIGDGQEYTYGDLRMTSDTTVTLTLKSVDFPKETLLTYNYVRIYGLRAFANPTGNITITYEDTLELTTCVDIYINYKNGTNAYNATVASDSFVHTWASAVNATDYAVDCNIAHQRYGNYTWRQYFPQTFSEMPWGLGFLGTLPFNTAYILPAFLLIFLGGCFTVINAQLGAFVTVVTACILAYIGWLPIPAATLIVAFTLAILMALIYAKRRVTIG